MQTRQLSFVAVAACVLVLGCQQAPPDQEAATRIDLRAALTQSSVSAVGVAVAPDTGRWIVFDEQTGLFEVDASGNASVVVSMDAMPDPGVDIRYPFTDVVALGQGRFAVTAIGDGFLLDVGRQTMQQHFCYVPEDLPSDLDQRANAVAYDPATNQLLAQPQSFDPATDTLVASQIARYDGVSGADLDWYGIDTNFLAGGMAVEAEGTVLLGAGSKLFRYDFTSYTLSEIDELSRFGVSSIDGLAIDSAGSSLLIVDDELDELVELKLAQLAD